MQFTFTKCALENQLVRSVFRNYLVSLGAGPGEFSFEKCNWRGLVGTSVHTAALPWSAGAGLLWGEVKLEDAPQALSGECAGGAVVWLLCPKGQLPCLCALPTGLEVHGTFPVLFPAVQGKIVWVRGGDNLCVTKVHSVSQRKMKICTWSWMEREECAKWQISAKNLVSECISCVGSKESSTPVSSFFKVCFFS